MFGGMDDFWQAFAALMTFLTAAVGLAKTILDKRKPPNS
jgi:hypothetical protein